jgi:LPS sulfotransferase NodH
MFIIIASKRTGTTMLSRALNMHPDLTIMGEIFKHKYTNYSNPTNLVRKWVDKPTFGWNLKYGQARPTITEYLKPPTQIIHLIRNDLLALSLSQKMARNRKFYMVPNSSEITVDVKSFAFDPGTIAHAIKSNHMQIKGWEDRIKDNGYRAITIYYEHITHSKTIKIIPKHIAQLILAFIGVEYKKLSTKLVKLNPRPEDFVKNYDELRALPNRYYLGEKI